MIELQSEIAFRLCSEILQGTCTFSDIDKCLGNFSILYEAQRHEIWHGTERGGGRGGCAF